MKHKIISFALGLLLVSSVGVGTVQASEIEGNTSYDVVNINTEDSTVQPRFGFRWQCHDCDHVGHWQISYNTASKHAMAHHQRTGHRVYVYGV